LFSCAMKPHVLFWCGLGLSSRVSPNADLARGGW
jgi:hypothetical protein